MTSLRRRLEQRHSHACLMKLLISAGPAKTTEARSPCMPAPTMTGTLLPVELLLQLPPGLSLEQALAEKRELLGAHVLRSGRAQQIGLGQAVLLRRLFLGRLDRLRCRLFYCFSTKHCSNPLIKRSRGRFLPMKTMVLERFSSFPQARPRSPPISMCTPWNTTRCALPFMYRIPL